MDEESQAVEAEELAEEWVASGEAMLMLVDDGVKNGGEGLEEEKD